MCCQWQGLPSTQITFTDSFFVLTISCQLLDQVDGDNLLLHVGKVETLEECRLLCYDTQVDAGLLLLVRIILKYLN